MVCTSATVGSRMCLRHPLYLERQSALLLRTSRRLAQSAVIISIACHAYIGS